MISFRSTVQRALELTLVGILFWPLTAAAIPIGVEISNYFVADGKRHSYFDGKLLTADELNREQSYKLGVKRYLGRTDLPLDDLFLPAGHAGVFLFFDDAEVANKDPSKPANPHNPHGEDMIFLDTSNADKPIWKGQLYLAGLNGIGDGLYDNLSGTFDRLVPIPEPASIALMMLGLTGLWRVRRIRFYS
ncbi:MAG: PEP-CTERM sorting domain-containing protein [Gammaproteobacteria bacterium]|nr:PEP-CTERM sorting domain-containing protein [Gammaproteobacteria bacterium]